MWIDVLSGEHRPARATVRARRRRSAGARGWPGGIAPPRPPGRAPAAPAATSSGASRLSTIPGHSCYKEYDIEASIQ